MKSRIVKNSIAILTLALLFLTGPAGVQAYVWCLDGNGHAALERAAGKTCGAGAGERSGDYHDEEARGKFLQEEGCGPCYDLPTTFDAASRRARGHFDNFSPQATFLTDARNFCSPPRRQEFFHAFFPQPPPRIDQALIAHRTVVLLN